METDFEYDPGKSDANRAKHGIDFEEAQKLWLDKRRVAFVARFADETRSGLIAQCNGLLWTAIYTLREDRIRLISVRRARKNEEKLYDQSEGF